MEINTAIYSVSLFITTNRKFNINIVVKLWHRLQKVVYNMKMINQLLNITLNVDVTWERLRKKSIESLAVYDF